MVMNLMPWRKKKESEVEMWRPRRYEDPTYDLTRGMSDMVDHLFRRFDTGFDLDRPLLRNNFGFSGLPSVDITETGEDVTVSADLPGLDEKDIKVTLDGDTLTLRGERKHEKEEKSKNYRRVECSYGTFVRSVTLPEGIDENNIKASFKKGVLNIRIGKIPGLASSRKHIPVETG